MFAEEPVAIIDIGSNSVRIDVYTGAKQIPSVIFNEKVLAGLGRDLGGGSLELVVVSDGRVGRSASLPLGVLRLDALAEKGDASFARKVAKAVAGAGFEGAAAGRPFYMVGGSWRALARLEM